MISTRTGVHHHEGLFPDYAPSRPIDDVGAAPPLRANQPLFTHHVPRILLTGLLLLPLLLSHVEAAKRKPARVTPPDLRIVAVTVSPNPYTPGAGSVDFAVDIELPLDIAEGTLLEVSSLLSSTSMSAVRFLSNRQPVTILESGHSDEAKPRVAITLVWDGTDQSKQPAQSGRYEYEIRAKLLTSGENGARTHMNSWPKRGTLVVK